MSRNRLDERRTEHRSVKLGVNPARRSGRARWMFPLVAVTTIVLALAIWVAVTGVYLSNKTPDKVQESSAGGWVDVVENDQQLPHCPWSFTGVPWYEETL